MEVDRKELRAWLKRVMMETDLTATALARKAGLAQSTLTRFLRDDGAAMIGLRTITKIASVTGIDPPGLVVSEQRRRGFSEGDAEPYDGKIKQVGEPTADVIRSITQGSNSLNPWVLHGRALESAGYMPGDILIVDINLKPQRGDIVCAQHYFWKEGRAETIFRIYEPPYLVAASLDAQVRRPLLVDGDQIAVKGVVVSLVRPRTKAA